MNPSIQKVRWKILEVSEDRYVKRSKSTVQHWLRSLTWISRYKSKGFVRLDKKGLSQIRAISWIKNNYRIDITGINKMYKMKTLQRFLDMHGYVKPNYFA